MEADAAGAADGTGPPSTSSASSAALVVTGLPVTWRPASDVLRALMSVFGPVAGVAVDAAAGTTSAVVLFEQGEGRDPVRAALAAARAGRVVAVAEADLPPLEHPIGLKAWVEGHKGLFPGTEAWQAGVKGGEGGRGEKRGGGERWLASSTPRPHAPTHSLTSLPPAPHMHSGRRLDGRL